MTDAPRGVSAARGGKATETPILVMVGAPGAGKGTQTVRIAERLQLPSVSTGDLFRAALRDGTELGEHVRPYLETGRLVPDDVTIEVIAARLAEPDAAHGVILDGFPRTRAQAEALDTLAGRLGFRVTAALYVQVEVDELVRRLSGRRVCTGGGRHIYHVDERPSKVAGICDIDGSELEVRVDDRPDTIRERLERQLPPMFDVVDHYNGTGALRAIRGDRPVDEVTEELLRSIAPRASAA
jgi:adenylate kinase